MNNCIPDTFNNDSKIYYLKKVKTLKYNQNENVSVFFKHFSS